MSQSSLAKAKLKAREAGVDMTVCFNPKELTVDKQVSWTPKEGAVSDEPPHEFTKPTPATLSVNLHLDTYEDGGPVTVYTEQLEKLANIMANPKRPPLTIFSWANFTFQGVVTSLSLRYTMFRSNGEPCRCEASLRMQKASEAMTGKGT